VSGFFVSPSVIECSHIRSKECSNGSLSNFEASISKLEIWILVAESQASSSEVVWITGPDRVVSESCVYQ